MEIPKLDRRDRRDILEEIRVLAASYVPQWRWDAKDPDAGLVFASLFAAMMENTITRYNRSMYNHYLAFLNLLGTQLKPPSPAEGMISVGVEPGGPGGYLEKGMQVYAAAENETGRVFYETAEAMYALDVEIDRIFFTSAARDSIVCAYRRDAENDPVRLFGFDIYPELQQHLLYFRDDAVFYTRDSLDFSLSITHSRSLRNRRSLPELFSDPACAVWEYHNNGVWYEMDQVTRLDQGVRLRAGRGSLPAGEAGNIVRCRLKQIPPGGLYFTDVQWSAQNAGLRPDALSGSASELPQEQFAPFGDILTIFTDFNISNREAFTKAGAEVSLVFDLEFMKTPIERQDNGVDMTQYLRFMSEEDFVSVREQDVWIERVRWEYWNGLGWARLFPSGEYEDFFTPMKDKQGVQRLTFRCPGDMEEVTLGASSGLFIRARIDKLSNMLSIAGNYIVPFVHQMNIGYQYRENGSVCRSVWVESNVERVRRELPDEGVKPIMTASLCPSPAMYLCLTQPLTGGPIRIFWDIEEGIFPDAPSLRWEYYGTSGDGTPRWKSMERMDLTENLTRSALVTLVGKQDFVRVRLFGAEGYFLRLVDAGGRYDHSSWRQNPVIQAIWPNTVPVVQRERRAPEYFYIARGEANKRCRLSVSGLSEVQVWVNESGTLSVKEEERFLADPQARVERSAEGQITGLWVPWHEIASLEAAGPEDRVFCVDYANSTICFGDGRRGRIPPDRTDESICIVYAVCSGSLGNVPPNAVQGLASRPPGISWVTNHKRISGGSDLESIQQAADRTVGELLGMDRIVTLEDFRRAALAADRSIVRVRCVPHVDRYNQEAEGRLSIAILPQEYRQGCEMFAPVARAVRQALTQRASLLFGEAERVDIFEVHYVELCVSVEIVINDYNCYHQVHQDISRQLRKFLNPITGNFNGQGWEIGRLPSRELIYNSIKTVKNIKWIKSLHLFPYMTGGQGREAAELRELQKDAFAVPVYGEPEISLSLS